MVLALAHGTHGSPQRARSALLRVLSGVSDNPDPIPRPVHRKGCGMLWLAVRSARLALPETPEIRRHKERGRKMAQRGTGFIISAELLGCREQEPNYGTAARIRLSLNAATQAGHCLFAHR